MATDKQFKADRKVAQEILRREGREVLARKAANLEDHDPARWATAEAYWSVVHPHNK